MKSALFQSPLRQIILVQTQIMTHLMQKGRPNFVTKKFLIRLRNVPNVFQKQNNLRRHRNIFLVRKFRPGEQAQSVRFNSIRLQIRIRLAFKSHRQFLRALAQRPRQRRQHPFNFIRCHYAQLFPIQIHEEIVTCISLHDNLHHHLTSFQPQIATAADCRYNQLHERISRQP